MSGNGKLAKSLDDILKDRKNRNRGQRRRNVKGPAPAAAPAGGVKKIVKSVKAGGKAAAPTGPSSGTGPSKIIVSNLPADVTEQQIKEYFVKSVGPIQKVLLQYGPNGQSRGIATIIFTKAGSASEAATKLDGLKVDGRPMKIEVIINAKDAPPPAPVKSLTDRISGPKPVAKPQPKPATAVKKAATAKAGAKKTRNGRNPARGKPKTAEELDAEMQDYFNDNTATSGQDGDTAMVTNGGAVQPVANGGDTGMEDEIL